MVMPCSFSLRKSSMMSSPWLECRFPVGSSANKSFGSAMIARADSYQLLLSTGKLTRI